MIATSSLTSPGMDSPQERDRSDRLRTRLSGAGGIMPISKAQTSRRRSESLDDTASQVSMSSNAPTIGSGSHLGSPRIARTSWSRRPKVAFPTTSSHHSTGSTTDSAPSFLRQRSSRHSLKSAMKMPQRPSTPPLPTDPITGPSFASLSDSQESCRRSRRSRRLSFKEPSSKDDSRRRFMRGGWAESFLPPVTNANALMRREPPAGAHHQQPAAHDSFESETDYTDSELSDDTHATTVMSDATVGSPKVQKKQTTTVAPPVRSRSPRQSSTPAAQSANTASTGKSGGRTLTIEVMPARESEEEVRKREEEKRRRERIEVDLRSKIAGLERRMQAEAEDNARQQQQVQRQIASVAAKQKEHQAPASAPATPQVLAPTRQAPMPPQNRLSPNCSTDSTPSSPQLNAQARPFQPSPRPRSMVAMPVNVPPVNHHQHVPVLDVSPPFLQQPVNISVNSPLIPHPPMPMTVATKQPDPTVSLQQQIESQAKQLASLRATLSERNTLLAAAEAARDESTTAMAGLAEQCKTLEAEVHTVRAARSQSEEVTIAKLAACELVRDVLRIKIEGFESEVKTKAMVIEDLAAEKDRLAVALEAESAEVAVLSERSKMLEEGRERAHAEMVALKEELVGVRAVVDALEKEKVELEGRVVGLQGDLGNAQARVAELEGVVKEKDTCIEELKKGSDELKATNDELKKEVEQLASTGATKDEELVQAIAKLAEAEATLATSQSSLVAIETNLAMTTEEKTKEIADLQSKLTAAETTIATSAAEKEAELANLHEKLSSAEAQATKAQDELKDLQGKTPEDYITSVATMAREKDDLASKIAVLQAEVESRAAEANDMVTTFAAEKAALEKERLELDESRSAATAEAARLSMHVAQLKAKVEASKNKKTVPTTAAASAAAAVKSTKTVKTKSDFFFVRTSQDRGRMQVVKKSELKSSRSSSRTPSAKDE